MRLKLQILRKHLLKLINLQMQKMISDAGHQVVLLSLVPKASSSAKIGRLVRASSGQKIVG